MNEIVKSEFDKAIEAIGDDYFKPTLVNKYTGDVLPYKTPANARPDDGVLNTEKDLCHTEENISIQQIYARLKNMRQLSIQDAEYAYDERNLNDADLEDDFASDEADIAEDALDGMDLIDYIQNSYGQDSERSEQQVSDSAGQKTAVESKNKDEATPGAEDA